MLQFHIVQNVHFVTGLILKHEIDAPFVFMRISVNLLEVTKTAPEKRGPFQTCLQILASELRVGCADNVQQPSLASSPWLTPSAKERPGELKSCIKMSSRCSCVVDFQVPSWMCRNAGSCINQCSSTLNAVTNTPWHFTLQISQYLYPTKEGHPRKALRT